MYDQSYLSADAAAQSPLYKQVYSRFREAIANGSLPPGSRVPSMRDLASDLKLSRNTVATAYDLLVGEGYFVTRGQAGTVVSPYLRRSQMAAPAPARSSGRNHSLEGQSSSYFFQLGLPALDAFPYKLWNKLRTRRLALIDPASMAHPAAAGWEPLRQAIASHLQISRGIACAANQVFVTSGYRGALQLIWGTLLHFGDTVWVEDPCFPPTLQTLERLGPLTVPVPVDDEGIDVSAGEATGLMPNLVIVTPTHQSPLGVTLSPARRNQLLRLAERTDAWILEDDYDSEFRYDGRRISPLALSDAYGRTLYVGTFSKVLYPSLRLAYVVVPTALLISS
jgi:GntR family transcriptional regulator/MocR family aminotransferase